jgi:hypothetical protein
MKNRPLCDIVEEKRGFVMGRKPVPEAEKKETKGVTLPNWMWIEIEKIGGRSRIIENVLKKYFKKPENDDK